MWDRVFDPWALALFAFPAVLGFLVGLAAGRLRGEGAADTLSRGGEAAGLTALGGFLARAFVSLLLYTAGDSPAAALAVGWGFFLWPAAIDTPLVLMHCRPIFTPAVLMQLAGVVGSLVGLMDGLWRIHSWRGTGPLAFVLDVTWGLAGSANGCLIHLANLLLRARRDASTREGIHRYFNGFRIKRGFAVTLGSVMSNVPAHAGDLINHERQHVLQNRLFGPFYTLTYVGWMAVMLIPALVVGMIRGSPGRTIEDWCYLNNPWEVWAYARGGWRDPARVWRGAGRTVPFVLFTLGVLGAAGWIVWRVWLSRVLESANE